MRKLEAKGASKHGERKKVPRKKVIIKDSNKQHVQNKYFGILSKSVKTIFLKIF